jgi:hypothetical protein
VHLSVQHQRDFASGLWRSGENGFEQLYDSNDCSPRKI